MANQDNGNWHVMGLRLRYYAGQLRFTVVRLECSFRLRHSVGRFGGTSTMIPVNYWAVLLAALFTIVLGFLWYGPLFGRPWMRLAGIAAETLKPGILDFVVWIGGALLMSFGFANVLEPSSVYTHMRGVMSGLATGFWIWLSFVVPVTAGIVFSERKPPALWLLTASYYLVALCGIGAILALWPAT